MADESLTWHHKKSWIWEYRLSLNPEDAFDRTCVCMQFPSGRRLALSRGFGFLLDALPPEIETLDEAKRYAETLWRLSK